MFNLNKTSRIKIKTSVGESRSESIQPLITQASVEAAVISAKNLDSGVSEYVHKEKDNETEDTEKEEKEEEDNDKDIEDVTYSTVKLKSLLFQDDVLTPNKTPEAAQAINLKMVDLMESKLLDLHKGKSCYIVAGEKGSREDEKRVGEETPETL